MTKFRVSRWGNPFTGEVFYGIQAKSAGDTRYRHCCEGSTPLIFGTRTEASNKLRQCEAALHPTAAQEGE